MTISKEKFREMKLHMYRKEALDAAIDFGYGEEVVEAVKNAATEDDISKIMCMARLRS